jgi:hypothetical protein
LSDVGDDQRAGAAARPVVEAEAPRITQAEGPDLAERGNRLAIDERVVFRNAITARIAVGNRHVEAQHLAE